MNKLKPFVKIIGKGITILSIVFLVFAIAKLRIDFTVIFSSKILIMIFLVSSLFICIAEYLMAYAWKILLDFFSGQHCRCKEAACVYAKANIGKYLPGNVMHYVERNLFANNLGLKQRDIFLSTVIEVLSITGVSILLSFIFAYNHLKSVFLQLASQSMLFYCFGIGIFLLLSLYCIYVKKKSQIRIFLNQYSMKDFIMVLCHISAVYILFLLFGSAIMILLLYNLQSFSLTLANISLIAISYTIAWVLGFIVPGAPGGIGVREFALLFLLGNTFSSDVTVSAILLHRLITILGDLEAYIIAIALEKAAATNNSK